MSGNRVIRVLVRGNHTRLTEKFIPKSDYHTLSTATPSTPNTQDVPVSGGPSSSTTDTSSTIGQIGGQIAGAVGELIVNNPVLVLRLAQLSINYINLSMRSRQLEQKIENRAKKRDPHGKALKHKLHPHKKNKQHPPAEQPVGDELKGLGSSQIKDVAWLSKGSDVSVAQMEDKHFSGEYPKVVPLILDPPSKLLVETAIQSHYSARHKTAWHDLTKDEQRTYRKHCLEFIKFCINEKLVTRPGSESLKDAIGYLNYAEVDELEFLTVPDNVNLVLQQNQASSGTAGIPLRIGNYFTELGVHVNDVGATGTSTMGKTSIGGLKIHHGYYPFAIQPGTVLMLSRASPGVQTWGGHFAEGYVRGGEYQIMGLARHADLVKLGKDSSEPLDVVYDQATSRYGIMPTDIPVELNLVEHQVKMLAHDNYGGLSSEELKRSPQQSNKPK